MSDDAMVQDAPDAGDRQLLALALARTTAGNLGAAELIEVAGRLAARQPGMAATLCKTWIACNPGHPSLHAILFNYAVYLGDADDLAGAVNALREAIRLKPEFGPPHVNLGSALERLDQQSAAVEAWLGYVASQSGITPDAVSYKLMALKQAGRVLEETRQDAAAEDALRQSLELDPTQHDVAQHLVVLRQKQCKWPALEASGRIPASQLREAISPLSAAYYADDPFFHLANAHHLVRRQIGRVPQSLGRLPRQDAARPVPGRRLRVGYVSSDLRDHAVGLAMTDVLELHDRDRVELFAYYCGVAASDGTQRRARRAVEHWHDWTGVDDREAAAMVRQHGIDVLVDLNGHTKDARTKVFAQRPAPVAVNWFGYPGTMGTPYHHYLIADDVVVPPSHEFYYSEQVVRLPCYQPNDRHRVVAAPPSRQEAGLPAEGFVFCCLNGLQKLTAPTFLRWMAILRQVPGSVLWLFGGTEDTNDRLRLSAQGAGVAPERLLFADRMANPAHLARLELADLFLDTFPYGAHTTASDALWMGLPVLTLVGRSFAARVCASLVTAAGLPELVCRTADEYVARALELARDKDQLAALRARLTANRARCTLFDTPGLVRSLEGLYGGMHEDWLAGRLPQPDLRNLETYHEIGAADDLGTMEELDDVAYVAHYRQRLAQLDADFPVPPDGRLWPG